MRHIHRVILSVLFLFGGIAAEGQTYGNEWIDYSKTYYKFRIAQEGIYRIPTANLLAAGIPAFITGNQFVLYRNGQEVPLYVTTTGAMGANDYLEFYGKGPDGTLDKDLYANPNWHINDNVSLFTDTATYFLSYGVNIYARYTPVNLPVIGTPSPLPYSWFTATKYFKGFAMPGRSYDPDYDLFSAQFDGGEAWVDNYAQINSVNSYNIATPNLYTNGPNATLKINLAAFCPYSQQIPFRVFNNNQQIIIDTLFLNPSTTKRLSVQLSPLQLQQNNTISYTTNPYTQGGTNMMGTAQAELQYPRDNNLQGQSQYKFNLKASPSNNQYLEFTNFSDGGVNPRLYDITNRKVYEGDISVAGVVHFYIEPSPTERTLVMVAQNAIVNASSVKSVQFTDYGAVANQGNYVLISHNRLMLATDGQNYVQKYKEYRSSPAGGGYTVTIADVEELYDQFAYGLDIHPLSIKNFLRYAHTNWTNKPEYALLLGRGLLYSQYKAYKQNPTTYPFPIVPTFGDPGSDIDFVAFGANKLAKLKIGRISAWNGMEIGNYLTKVRDYEAALNASANPTAESEFWKKRFLHIAGGSDAGLQATLLETLDSAASIIRQPQLSAFVTTVAKNTSTPIDQAGSEQVNAMIDSGLYWLTFHGHASAGNFDFNLNNPEQYSNQPRLMHILALGCDVSQIFSLTLMRTISERYINATGGAVSITAQDNLGYPSFHELYIRRFYRSITSVNYGSNLGSHYNQAYDSTLYHHQITNNANNFTYTQLESLLLLGDPATKMYANPKPDYHVSNTELSTLPANVSTTLDSFKLRVNTYNLGKAIADTVFLKVEHTNPQGITTQVGIYPIINLYNKKEYLVSVPINKAIDIGLNRYSVTIDHDGQFDESSEINNGATMTLFIFSDKLIPVYPPEFAIVGNSDITLKASTLNPFRPTANYRIDLDTTELFNSPQRQQFTTTSNGGVIQWKPSIAYNEDVVYYWRTALDSGNNSQLSWTTSSFVYLPQKWGWNQSHYFQYLKDNFSTLSVAESDRQFKYTERNNNLAIFNVVLDPAGIFTADDSKVMYNDVDLQRSGCEPYVGTLQIMVFDPRTGKQWVNDVNGTAGAYPRCFGIRNTYCFEYPLNSQDGRNKAMNFINSVPDGHYIMIKNFIYAPTYQASFVNQWTGDNGGSNNLYTTIKALGFAKIDSFDKLRTFIMFSRKNNNDFPKTQLFSVGASDKIQADIVIPASDNNGIMFSKNVGPAKQWETLKWKTTAKDNLPQNDSVYVKVIGLSNNNAETFLFNTTNTDTAIGGISASAYPSLRLEWYTKDTVIHTSSYLDYWRVHYVPVPEAALNPNAHLVFNDSLYEGQNASLQLAIEELSGRPMDSMLVKYKVIDANGVAYDLNSARYKKLNGNDTLHAGISFDASAYPGNNFLFIEANPDNDQPEQYHPNNLGYLPFKVVADKFNPIIDVTFDGVHILDRDIVSAKPFIKMMLKDENKFLKLDDTSLVSVSITYLGDGSAGNQGTPLEIVPFDGTTAKFIPADNEKNEAFIEYKPVFLQDGFYELGVNGKDKKGNRSGATDYRIQFEVINKSSITNVLNYPNPFSTSTAFLFTLTGWQIPSQFKIQILTVTGKVVREITKAELGPLHVGRNITEYKWDGKDQYGQMLGNGVYLYRVVTAIDGKDIEHRAGAADKFTQKGWGKMYIMR